jgi:exosortase/archaeosortase family protein
MLNLVIIGFITLFTSYQWRCITLYWNGESYNPIISIISALLAPITALYLLKHASDYMEFTDKAHDQILQKTILMTPKKSQKFTLKSLKVLILQVNTFLSVNKWIIFDGLIFSILIIGVYSSGLTQYNFLNHAWIDTHHGIQHHTYIWALLIEGICFWLCTLVVIRRLGSIQYLYLLSYPLGLLLLSLPWEICLQNYSEVLQALGSDLAVYLLDILSWGAQLNIGIEYWNHYTFYSDQFYLLINQSCSGINLLTSMILYAWIYSWFMQFTPFKAIKVSLYMIPVCVLCNALRIAIIFLLGHYGGEQLAMGMWHEGTGYICQLFLLILWAYLFPYEAHDDYRSSHHETSSF